MAPKRVTKTAAAPKRVTKSSSAPRRSTRTHHAPELFSTTEDSVTKPTASTAAATAPKGRGRPPKNAPKTEDKPVKATKKAVPAAKTTPASGAGRGRGRPKKTEATAPATKPAAKPASKMPTTKKGPGRPRKSDADGPASKPAPATTTTTGRGRGRPKKEEITVSAPTAPSPRGRGRPRKEETITPAPPARPTKTPVSRKAPTSRRAPTTTPTTKAKAKTPAQPVQAHDSAEKRPRGRPPKRRADDEPEAPVAKKPKAAPKAKTPLSKAPKLTTPNVKLTIFVAGAGENGELGLGTGKVAVNVKRPRKNANLLPQNAGVVQLSVGGMHVVALTHDSKILTWGVNDQGALGRDTTWDGGLRDADAEDSDSDSEGGGDFNPHESTPAAVDSKHFPSSTKFVQVAASDSASFARTSEGKVYGWGTFRDNNGILGFIGQGDVQSTPVLINGLTNITSIACGNNHALALDTAGNVFSWGTGQQHQLGREVPDAERFGALHPHEFGLPKNGVEAIFAGLDHSFALTTSGQVYAWGNNSFGQCGIQSNAGESSAIVPVPTLVKQLSSHKIAMLAGGASHTLAITKEGDCLAWGNTYKSQLGLDVSTLPESDVARSEATGKIAMLKVPTLVSALPKESVTHVACGTDHSIAVTKDGRAYSWGFSVGYQTGQGTDDDVTIATLIDNTATRTESINWAGAGGQFSVFTSTGPRSEGEQAAGGSASTSSTVYGVSENTINGIHANGVGDTSDIRALGAQHANVAFDALPNGEGNVETAPVTSLFGGGDTEMASDQVTPIEGGDSPPDPFAAVGVARMPGRNWG